MLPQSDSYFHLTIWQFINCARYHFTLKTCGSNFENTNNHFQIMTRTLLQQFQIGKSQQYIITNFKTCITVFLKYIIKLYISLK